jgi:APA family basic amino acid/polyamine antiporter
MAMANDRLFPPVFAKLSGRGTPTLGMIIGGVLTTALIAANYTQGLVSLFTFIILLATLSVLVPYAFCALAVFVDPAARAAARARRGVAVVAALAFIYSMVAIGGAGPETVYWGFILLLAGLPVYVRVVRGRAPEAARA